MPLRRCKFYDDDGQPVGSGCHREGKGCDFAHPNDPSWSSSPSIRRDSGDFASARGQRGRGRGRGRGGVPDRSGPGSGWGNGASADHASDGWGAPPPASGTSGWDTSGWGAATAGWGASDAPKEQAQDGGWGQPAADGGSRGISDTPKPRAQDGGGGWGKSGADASKRAQDGGWGQRGSDGGSRGTSDITPRVQDGTWGQSASDGGSWGNAGASDAAPAEGGWGQPVSGGGASSTGNSGEWGVPGSSELSKWTRRSAIDLNGSARDAAAKDSKQTPGGRKDSISSSLPLPPRRPSVDKPLHIPASGSWADGQSNRAVSPPRPPRRYSFSTSVQDDGSVDGSHVTRDNDALSSSRAPSPAPTDHTASTSRLPRQQMSTTTLSDRQKVWKNLIAHTTRAVRTEIELRQLEQGRDHWKSTQDSRYYGHAGQAVRDKLNDTRKADEKKISDCKKRLATLINALVEFPEMSQILATNFTPEADQAEAREYISSVKEWVDGRRSTILQPEPQDAPPTRETSVEEGQIESPPSKKRRRSSTPASAQTITPASNAQTITSRVEQAEARMAVVEQKWDDTAVFREWTTISDPLREGLKARPNQLGSTHASAAGEGQSVPEQCAQLSARASRLKNDMDELVLSTAPVLSEANEQGEALRQLRAEQDQFKRDNVLMHERELGFQKLLQEESVLVQQASERVKQLLNKPRSSPPVFKELHDSIVAHATDAVLQDVRPLLDSTVEKCRTRVREENVNIFTKVWNKLEPTIKLKWIEVNNHNRGKA